MTVKHIEAHGYKLQKKVDYMKMYSQTTLFSVFSHKTRCYNKSHQSVEKRWKRTRLSYHCNMWNMWNISEWIFTRCHIQNGILLLQMTFFLSFPSFLRNPNITVHCFTFLIILIFWEILNSICHTLKQTKCDSKEFCHCQRFPCQLQGTNGFEMAYDA